MGLRLPKVSGSGEGEGGEPGVSGQEEGEGRGGVDTRSLGSTLPTRFTAKQIAGRRKTVLGRELSYLKSLSLCSSLGRFWGYDAPVKKKRRAWNCVSPPGPRPMHLDLEWLFLYTGLVTVRWDHPKPLFLSPQSLAQYRAELCSRQPWVQPGRCMQPPQCTDVRRLQRLQKKLEDS